jgi:hypothetical protein
MDRGTPPSEKAYPGNLNIVDRNGKDACEDTQAEGGATLALGEAFVRTVRHFFPRMNEWLDALPDTRFQPFVTYDRKFLSWWGLLLFVMKLGSRRQLDLQDLSTEVLSNVNQLASTQQVTLPVHNTLLHFLGHVGPEAFASVILRSNRRLLRMKVFKQDRLEGHYVVATDGTGTLSFTRPHCSCCLTKCYGSTTLYFHPVLEAKLVTDYGFALSRGSEFIENPILRNTGKKLHFCSAYQNPDTSGFFLKLLLYDGPVLLSRCKTYRTKYSLEIHLRGTGELSPLNPA